VIVDLARPTEAPTANPRVDHHRGGDPDREPPVTIRPARHGLTALEDAVVLLTVAKIG
jgi:hypothetical protein